MPLAETRYEHIVLNQDGVPSIAGTTMKVIELVTAQAAYGWSAEELHFQFPYLSLGRIHSALACYRDHREEWTGTSPDVSPSPNSCSGRRQRSPCGSPAGASRNAIVYGYFGQHVSPRDHGQPAAERRPVGEGVMHASHAAGCGAPTLADLGPSDVGGRRYDAREEGGFLSVRKARSTRPAPSAISRLRPYRSSRSTMNVSA